jgi:hypothetical protein
MAKAAFSSERPVQLAGTAGGNTLKTSSFNLVTSTRIETTTEERKVNEFTRCETDTVYEQYTKPPPPPPAPSPTPTPSGGGGDGGDDYDGPSPGNYFYKAPDSPSKGIGGSGGAETLDDALNQLPHDDLGNHLGTVTPR